LPSEKETETPACRARARARMSMPVERSREKTDLKYRASLRERRPEPHAYSRAVDSVAIGKRRDFLEHYSIDLGVQRFFNASVKTVNTIIHSPHRMKGTAIVGKFKHMNHFLLCPMAWFPHFHEL